MPDDFLDDIGTRILEALQIDGRLSYSQLARRIGVSTPTVIERVRKLEDAGIIQGFTVKLDLEKLGYGKMALIEVKTNPTSYPKVLEFASRIREIRECYFVTGDSSFVARVVMRDIADLQGLIERFGMFGATRTSVVLSKPIIKETFDLERPT
jgi:Lrp/AsnC family transcriptional regulator, leucine-responsive regulatory protein